MRKRRKIYGEYSILSEIWKCELPFHRKMWFDIRFEQTKEIDEETMLREKGELEQTMEDMDEEEEDLLEDRTAKLEEQQELLDEIQRNRQRTNGYLDDDLLNRSVFSSFFNFFLILKTSRMAPTHFPLPFVQ